MAYSQAKNNKEDMSEYKKKFIPWKTLVCKGRGEGENDMSHNSP